MSTASFSPKFPQRILNFIGGDTVEPLSKEWIESVRPATGEVIFKLPSSGPEDVSRAVVHAENAFKEWKNWSPEKRGELLEKIAVRLEERIDEFAQVESWDQGKPVWLAREMDIPRAILNFRYFGKLVREHKEKSFWNDTGALSYVVRKPVGIVGCISPWNLPLYLLTWKIAPALACGNVVVAKPSEMTSATAYLLCEVFNEVGVPRGVVNMVFGLGAKAGQALVEHPKVNAISFTGGTVTGQKISESVVKTFKKVSLELGGKNPNVVFADADFDKAVAGSVRAAFLNQGEICLCGSRLYVHESIFDKFVKGFVEAAQKIKVGDPALPENFMGALISDDHRNKVMSYVDLARKEGAKIWCGGKIPELASPWSGGYFYEPTVITGVDPYSRVQQEEIFGPVVTITPFKDDEEAIALANSTAYGLAGSIWTNDLKRIEKMQVELDLGTLWVNGWMIRDVRMPFGGVKASGVGREGGEDSLDFYSERKTVCIRYRENT